MMENNQSTTSSMNIKELELPQLPWKGYDGYFTLIRMHEDNYVIKCITCSKQYSVHKRASSNLKRHMQKVHQFKLQEFLKATTNSTSDTKRSLSIGCDTLKNKKFLQAPFERFGSGVGRDVVSQKTLDLMILKFIVSETQPLRIVDQSSFINLVCLGLPKHLSVMCSKTLKSKINIMFDEMKTNLIDTLGSTLWVSTTADCWTQGKRSFIGVTCHWIEDKTLLRKNGTLACSRIEGKHTYDIIAQKIYSIHQDYKISNKVLSCTTDNGSNFVNAFKEFSKELPLEDDENDNQICFIDLFDILNEGTEEKDDLDNINLPLHRRCASHTINLIATNDIEKALSNIDNKCIYNEREKKLLHFKKVYRKVIAKIQKLWNKQNQSCLVAEKIHEQFGVYLKSPSQTRWNGLYDGISQINNLLKVPLGSNKFHNVFDFCSIPRFGLEEIDFIQEYVDVMKPLADSLDFLQGEKSVYMGFLLPTLYALQKKYNKLKVKNFTICGSLVEIIVTGIDKRFSPIWCEKNLIIAACLISQFKLKWLNDTDMYNTAEEWLKTEFNKLNQEELNDSSSSDENVSESEDFFCMLKSKPNNIKPDQQLSDYLKSTNTELTSLLKYPKVVKTFIYFNVGLPSSASVERLFSAAGGILVPQRQRLSNSLFEKLLLLKCNT